MGVPGPVWSGPASLPLAAGDVTSAPREEVTALPSPVCAVLPLMSPLVQNSPSDFLFVLRFCVPRSIPSVPLESFCFFRARIPTRALCPDATACHLSSVTPLKDFLAVAFQGPSRRRKNIPEFLGETNIPTQDVLVQLGGALPSVGTGPDTWKNRAASRFSGFFSSSAGAGPFKVTLVASCQQC